MVYNEVILKIQLIVTLILTLSLLPLAVCSQDLKIKDVSNPDSTAINFYIINHNDSSKESPYKNTLTYLFNALKNDTSLKQKFKLVPKNTTGSFHTAIKIDKLQEDSSTYGIGIAQSDALYHYLDGNHPHVPVSKTNSDIRAISKLFKEWLHISIETKDTPLLIEKMRTTKQVLSEYDVVEADKIGSGSFVTALNVGRILNLNWSTISTTPTTGESLKFRVLTPSQNSAQLKNDFQLGLDEPSALLISSSFPNVYDFVPSDSLFSKYPNPIIKKYNRTTISVDAILICSQNLPVEIVDRLYFILNKLEVDSSIYSLYTKESFKSILFADSNQMFVDLPINRHYRIVEEKTDGHSKFWVKAVSQPLLGVMFVIAVIYLLVTSKIPLFKNVFTYEHIPLKNKFNYIINSSFKVIMIIVIFGLYHYFIAIFIYVSEYYYAREHVTDDKLISKGVGDTFLWVMKHLTIGNEAGSVNSNLAMFWVGILQFSYALVTSIAGYFAFEKFFNFIKSKKMKNHVVIIGWSPIGLKVVSELDKMNELYNKEIIEISVIGSLAYEETNVPEEFKNHYLKKHDLHDDLKKVRLEKAKAVIILSDLEWSKNQSNTDVDLWAINRVNDLNNYLKHCKAELKVKSESNNEPRIIVEIANEKNMQLAENNGADEVICVQFFGLELLAQAATRPHISKVFQKLLRSTKDSNEIYYRKIPQIKSLNEGISYSELIRTMISKDLLLNQTPIGIFRRNSEMKQELNPTDDFKIELSDELIVMAKEVNW